MAQKEILMKSIETMTKQELIQLHEQVGERLRYVIQLEAQDKMSDFYYGDVVSFSASDGRTITGKIERFNQKSVSVVCPHGHRWRVSPQLIKKIPTGVLSAPFQIVGT